MPLATFLEKEYVLHRSICLHTSKQNGTMECRHFRVVEKGLLCFFKLACQFTFGLMHLNLLPFFLINCLQRF